MNPEYTNHAFEMQKEAVALSADAIIEAAKQSRPRVPESIFKEYFLPALTDTENPRHNILYWIEHAAKSPNVEVVIVDDNTGAELFVVPAIFNDSSMFDVASTRMRSIVDVLYEASLISRDSNTAAQFYYKKVFGNAVQLNNPESSVNRWLQIFKRYNIKLPGLDNAIASTPDTSKNESVGEDAIYSGDYSDPDI